MFVCRTKQSYPRGHLANGLAGELKDHYHAHKPYGNWPGKFFWLSHSWSYYRPVYSRSSTVWLITLQYYMGVYSATHVNTLINYYNACYSDYCTVTWSITLLFRLYYSATRIITLFLVYFTVTQIITLSLRFLHRYTGYCVDTQIIKLHINPIITQLFRLLHLYSEYLIDTKKLYIPRLN